MNKLYPLSVLLFLALSCGKDNGSTDPTPTPTPTPIQTPEAVGLGLPSGIKWASFNIGATKPEEYGRYFSWGDVTGQTWDEKKWSGSGFNSILAFDTDKNGNLKAEYDAAHVLLGGNWRMPTKTDMEELTKNCTSQWTSNYNNSGIKGRIFTSKMAGYSDKSIFLPSNGVGDKDSIYNLSSYGYYWSSTFCDGSSSYNIFFYSGGIGIQIDQTARRSGLCIRPVTQ